MEIDRQSKKTGRQAGRQTENLSKRMKISMLMYGGGGEGERLITPGGKDGCLLQD